ARFAAASGVGIDRDDLEHGCMAHPLPPRRLGLRPGVPRADAPDRDRRARGSAQASCKRRTGRTQRFWRPLKEFTAGEAEGRIHRRGPLNEFTAEKKREEELTAEDAEEKKEEVTAEKKR